MKDELHILRDEIYGVAHENARQNELLYSQKIRCYQPVGQPPTVPSTAIDIIDSGVSQTATGYPIYNTKPYKTDDERTIGDKLKEACVSTTERSRALGGDPDKETAFYLNLYGMGVQKFRYFPNDDEWAFGYEAISPLMFYPDPAMRFVIEAYRARVSQIKETIDLFNESKRDKVFDDSWYIEFKNDYDEIEWCEKWSKGERQYYLLSGAGESIKRINLTEKQENHFKEIPYKWRYSGKGRGVRAKPEERMISAYHGIESIIQAEARAWSVYDNNLRINAYPEQLIDEEYARFWQEPSGPNKRRFIPKEGMPSEKGYEIAPESRVNPDNSSFLQMLSNSLQAKGADPVMRGMASPEVSGRAFEGRVQQGALLFEAPRNALSEIKGEIFSMMARLCGNKFFNPDGIKLSKTKSILFKDIPDNIKIEVEMEVKNPMYDQMMMETGLRLLERGVINIQMFVEEYMKKPDAADHLAKILAEKVMLTSPEMQAQMVIEALIEQGYDEQAQQLQIAMQGGEQGQATGQNAASHTQTIDERQFERTGEVGRGGLPNEG